MEVLALRTEIEVLKMENSKLKKDNDQHEEIFHRLQDLLYELIDSSSLSSRYPRKQVYYTTLIPTTTSTNQLPIIPPQSIHKIPTSVAPEPIEPEEKTSDEEVLGEKQFPTVNAIPVASGEITVQPQTPRRKEIDFVNHNEKRHFRISVFCPLFGESSVQINPWKTSIPRQFLTYFTPMQLGQIGKFYKISMASANTVEKMMNALFNFFSITFLSEQNFMGTETSDEDDSFLSIDDEEEDFTPPPKKKVRFELPSKSRPTDRGIKVKTENGKVPSPRNGNRARAIKDAATGDYRDTQVQHIPISMKVFETLPVRKLSEICHYYRSNKPRHIVRRADVLQWMKRAFKLNG